MTRLLLIDDSRTYLAVIRRFLADCAVEVTTVESFPAAEEAVERIQPDIVCVDFDIKNSPVTGEEWIASYHHRLGNAEIAIVTGTPEAIRNSSMLDALGIDVVAKQGPHETRFWQRIKRRHLVVSADGRLRAPYLSVFISYGGPDEAIARLFYSRLQQEGVPAFLFAEDAPFGKKLHHVMRDGIEEHDRVLLLCSERSLTRPGVLNEIEEALARESRDGGLVRLIPCALDDYVFRAWSPENSGLASALRARVIADFRSAQEPGEGFERVFAKLLRVLRAA